MLLINSRIHIRNQLRASVAYLGLAAQRSAEYSARDLRLLGCLTALIPAAYVIDVLVGHPYFDTFAIRATAFALAIPLIVNDASKLRSRPHYHCYHVCLAAYALPFTFGLMLILNAASAPEGEQIEMLWIMQYLISLFLFIQLIHNGLLATALWIPSTIAAMSSLFFLQDVNWLELKRVALYPITGYLTAFFFGIITNRNVDYVNSEKLKAASVIGGNIAHELRTPLASIRSLARSVNKYSTALVETYDRAKREGMHSGELTAAQVSTLKDALTSIEEEVAYSNTIIDMLLLNTSERSPHSAEREVVQVTDCLREAIARYPFANSRERALVQMHVLSDFSIGASRLLIVHVFFNLLKNSVYYAQKAPKGQVEIRVGPHNLRSVEIIDTGPGISPNVRRHIFERFFTTANTGQGAGIGLSFCKMVMESIGGEIQCESQEGEHTTFRLIFPPVNR